MLTSILLVEDHPIVQIGLHQLIVSRWSSVRVDMASRLAEARTFLGAHRYDIAIVDLSLPDASGLDSVTQLRSLAPSLPILVLSLNHESAYAQRVLKLGAAGYLSKERASSELVQAMERVAAGGRYITQSQAERIVDMSTGQMNPTPHEQLSSQEHRVLVYLAEGKRLTEIGELMNLSPKTITTYRARVLDKLGVKTNRALIQYCLDHGVISR